MELSKDLVEMVRQKIDAVFESLRSVIRGEFRFSQFNRHAILAAVNEWQMSLKRNLSMMMRTLSSHDRRLAPPSDHGSLYHCFRGSFATFVCKVVFSVQVLIYISLAVSAIDGLQSHGIIFICLTLLLNFSAKGKLLADMRMETGHSTVVSKK